LGGPIVNAQDNCEYRSGGSGDWANDAIWECYSDRLEGWYPCDDDENLNNNDEPCLFDPPDGTRKATIRPGHAIHIEGTTEEINVLVIEDDDTTPGELELRSASSASNLAIGTTLTMETGTYDGLISFVDGSSTTFRGELIIDGSTIAAAGDIVAEATDGGGKITVNGTGFTLSGNLGVTAGTLTVDGDVVLSGASATSISGGGLTLNDSVTLNQYGTISVTGGTVTFNGSLENDGALSITGSSQARVEFYAPIAAGSSGNWTINNSDSGSWLKIGTGAGGTVSDSSGKITLIDGTIDVDETFQFNGRMDWTGTGAIDVASTKQFIAASTGG